MSYRAYFKKLTKFIIIILWMIIPIYSYSEQVAISQHLYKLYKGEILFGKSSYSLYKKDNSFFFEIVSKTDGVFKLKKDERIELSNYVINSGSISPLKYEYIREKKDKKDYIVTIFNGDSGVYTIDNGIKKEHHKVADTLDRLSVQIAYQEDLKNGNFESTYTVLDKGRLRKYIYTIHSDDVIDTVFGETNTIVIKRVIENNKRSTLTWYAVDHDFIPVKIEQYRKKSLKFTVYLDKINK